jgi:ATP dependent DNA ligase domain
MELNGEDLRSMALIVRKQKLALILRRHEDPSLRNSEPFKHGEQLLAECRQRGLEGIVSKRKHAPYKSGKCDWIKVKCAEWREEHKFRGSCLGRGGGRPHWTRPGSSATKSERAIRRERVAANTAVVLLTGLPWRRSAGRLKISNQGNELIGRR